MTKKQKQVVAHRLARAHETLAAANVLEDGQFYFSAINRLYYACFYAVTALLASRGVACSKRSGTPPLLNQHFVETGILSKRLGKFYQDLSATRREYDYADFVTCAPEELTSLHEAATYFVKKISWLIEKEFD